MYECMMGILGGKKGQKRSGSLPKSVNMPRVVNDVHRCEIQQKHVFCFVFDKGQPVKSYWSRGGQTWPSPNRIFHGVVKWT